MPTDPFSDPVPALPEKQKPMLEAVRDVVTVKSDAPRNKMGRSQTSTNPSQTSNGQTQRRTDDAGGKPLEKSKSTPGKAKNKKTGLHTDVIDKLDISGVGNIALHHDGPFDACAPSRNRHKHKAPMMAWANSPEAEAQADVPPVPSADPRLSARAQATMAAMAQVSPGFDNGPYPKVSSPGWNSNADWGSGPAPPKKRHDALAEAWGIAEPEPFEEFFAGGGDHSRPSSVRNGHEGKKTRDGRDLREVYKDYLDERPPTKRRETRSKLPPPAPIALPGQSIDPDDQALPSPSNYLSSSQDGTPKRSKSLLGRIKKMKQNPNLPLGATDERSNETSPVAEQFTSERNPMSPSGKDSFDANRLPTLNANNSTPNFSPPEKKGGDYFERPPTAGGNGQTTPGGGGGLGRKQSLMQKVVRGVRGNKQ